jgi:predicted SprT family Zn-dependent metalloprotease
MQNDIYTVEHSKLPSMNLTKSVVPRAPLKSSIISSTTMDSNVKNEIKDTSMENITTNLSKISIDEKSNLAQSSAPSKSELTSLFITSKLKEHGLSTSGWKWQWNNRLKTSGGSADYKSKTISLSPLYVSKASESEVQNTVLHEIAHALTPGHKHDEVWKAMAKSIGCNGNRCHEVEVRGDNAYKWLFRCERGCTSIPSITKRRKDGHCALCKEKLMFVPIGPLRAPLPRHV